VVARTFMESMRIRALQVGFIALAVVGVARATFAEDNNKQAGEVAKVEDSDDKAHSKGGSAVKDDPSETAERARPEGDSAKSSDKTKRVAQAPTIPGGDPRGEPDLVICSQNLKLFGTYQTIARSNPAYSKERHRARVDNLAQRFIEARCDVIAVQEVIGKNQTEGEAALSELVAELRDKTNRIYQAVTAPPTEGSMTNGFLIALDRATLLQSLPYGRVELPRISKKQRPRLFSRPPFEVQLSVKSRESGLVKPISVVNFHFKSKRGAKDDPTGLEWETYRMEMSEALRRIVEMRHKEAFASAESILVLLGDRNSNFDVASARILEGSLSLSSFGEKGPCRMSKRGAPICVVETQLPRRLFSVLTSNSSVSTYQGTFEYKGEYSWLDDILMPAESLSYAWRSAYSEAEFNSGLVYTPKDASDHALVYVKLNW
jgi:endonuclease/exonuclease/phosphatase family metal-dependent hydrolase